MADVCGNAGRGRPRKTYNLIGEVLQKGRSVLVTGVLV